MITWAYDGFRPWQYYDFDAGAITMPCFHDDGVLWIEVEERDRLVPDKMQVAIACKNLQIGANDIVVNVKEDNAGIANAADVTNSILGTSFNFGSSNDSKTAQYTFTFNAVLNCSLRNDQ